MLILATYVAALVSLHPTNFFGLFEDDSIYFSSAKALAQGQGYVLPSVPGTPPATKYPILYPLILSLVWRWNPSFPANLSEAVAVTVTFGIAYVIAGFFFLRRLQFFNDLETLCLTAFCALHPLVLFLSGNILSDLPFAALALLAMVLANESLNRNAVYRVVALCGVVAGLSMMMRIFGLAVVAGILVAGLAMRAWKKMAIFVTCVSPFFLLIAWRNISPPAFGVPPVSGEFATSLGWERAWAYYTNYIAIWKFGVPDAHIFWAMVRNNLELVIQAPADLFLTPLLASDTIPGRALMLLVSVLSFAGIVRLGMARGWRAFHYVFPFFVLMILCWNYSDASNRFLLPFYFMFLAGFWIEIKFMVASLRNAAFGPTSTVAEKVLAGILGIAVVGLCLGMTFNYASGRRRDVADLSKQRGKNLAGKQQAYRWLAQVNGGQCCPPVMAVEDANLYLYSGRMAMSPVLTFPTSTLYEESYLAESLDHLLDVAKALKADYWVFSDDDFSMESNNVAEAVRGCLGTRGPKEWPAAFTSSDGNVVIRSLKGLSIGANPCQRLKKLEELLHPSPKVQP